MLRLKFLTFKNLGSIARCRGDDSAALDAFIQVCLCMVCCEVVMCVSGCVCEVVMCLSGCVCRQWMWTEVK